MNILVLFLTLMRLLLEDMMSIGRTDILPHVEMLYFIYSVFEPAEISDVFLEPTSIAMWFFFFALLVWQIIVINFLIFILLYIIYSFT